MRNLRTYGDAPFRVAVLHGGPGAPGYMAPVARELARKRGVLEPLQTADSLDGQVEELAEVLAAHAAGPTTLIGSSWGALLGFIVAARHPALVKKLVLVGSAAFEDRYAAGIRAARLERLAPDERQELETLLDLLGDPFASGKDAAVLRESELLTKADHCDPLTLDTEVIAHQLELHQKVWGEAAELRRTGALLDLAEHIRCPVLAIHGDSDPHPVAGVCAPLARVLTDFRFVLLGRCGHLPWIERGAREAFFQVLEDEL